MKFGLFSFILILSFSCEKQTISMNHSSHIFAWTKDENGFDSDFLSVINADPNDRAYGSLVATLPV